MKRAWMIPTTITLLAAAAPQALASDISGVLDWSQFQVELTDLDVSDGIDPNITWGNQHTGVNVMVIPPGGVVSQGAANWTSPIGVAQGPASASASTASLTVDLTGMSSAVDHAEGSASRWGDFTLTRKTQARFILPASLTAADLSSHTLFVGATISMVLGDSTDPVFDTMYVGNGQPIARSLELTIDDTGDGSMTGNFGAGVSFFADPVPEPQTWAMLLAGLGLVALAARRRS